MDQNEDILNEFKGFVQALKRVGIDYSIVVNVEGGGTEHLTSPPHQSPSMVRSPSTDRKN